MTEYATLGERCNKNYSILISHCQIEFRIYMVLIFGGSMPKSSNFLLRYRITVFAYKYRENGHKT